MDRAARTNGILRDRRSARRLAVAAAGSAAAIGLLAGCSTANPGQAAIVGDTRIPETAIAEQMASLNELMGQPADTPSAELARTIVSYNVGYELIRETAAALAVEVPQAELDTVYRQQVEQLGGEQQLQQAAAQQGIPPANLRRDLETQLLATAIAQRAGAADPQAGQAALVAEVKRVAQDMTVEVAPRYGTWDSEQLQIVPDPNPVSEPEARPAPALQMPPTP